MRGVVAAWLTVAVAIVLVGAPPLCARSASAPSTVAFDVGQSGTLLVPVYIDEAGPYVFVLDTGASRSAIDKTLLAHLVLRPFAQAQLVSIAGARPADIVKLPCVSLGNTRAVGLVASVVADDDLHTLASGADGVLGQDFLAGFDYTIDYDRGWLRWDRPSEPPDGDVRLTLASHGNQLLVELPQDDGGHLVRFVPDSGAGTLVLFDTPAANRLSINTLPGTLDLLAFNGLREAQPVTLSDFLVGAHHLHAQPALLLSGSTHERTDADGLLPLRMFARAAFRSAARQLILEMR